MEMKALLYVTPCFLIWSIWCQCRHISCGKNKDGFRTDTISNWEFLQICVGRYELVANVFGKCKILEQRHSQMMGAAQIWIQGIKTCSFFFWGWIFYHLVKLVESLIIKSSILLQVLGFKSNVGQFLRTVVSTVKIVLLRELAYNYFSTC